jgi:hypothetical protein
LDDLRHAELVALVKAEQRQMAALLARLKPAHLNTPGVTGQWSGKNVLGHITFWHKRLLHVAARERRGLRADRLMWPGEDWPAALERINEQSYSLSQKQPLDVVLSDFRQTSHEVFEMVRGLNDAELERMRRLLTTGESLASLILNLAYDHPHEHRLAIQDWLLKEAMTRTPDT